MFKVFCFGNEFVKEDSLVKKIIREIKIKNVEFVVCDSADVLLDKDKIVILDVVKNLNDVKIIDDVEILKLNKACSAHDLDLGFYLKLLKEMDKLKDVKIIGIPIEGNKNKIKERLLKIIPSLFPRNE